MYPVYDTCQDTYSYPRHTRQLPAIPSNNDIINAIKQTQNKKTTIEMQYVDMTEANESVSEYYDKITNKNMTNYPNCNKYY